MLLLNLNLQTNMKSNINNDPLVDDNQFLERVIQYFS